MVGGGIAGLAAAWELTGGAAGPDARTPSVLVLEASERCGGKLETATLGDGPVDVGPDGFLGRRPEAAALCREVGLGDRLVPVGTSGAAIWARGKRRPLPGGLSLGIPTRVLPVARSGILSPAGVARLLVDLVAPRPDRRGPLGDRAIGPLLTRKLGHQAVERLVEPLLGGIHAGTVTDASAAALVPGLLDAAQGRTSLMRRLRHQAAPGAPAPGAPVAGAPVAGAPREGDDGEDGGGGESSEDGGGGRPGPQGAGSSKVVPLFWALDGGLATLRDRLVSELGARGATILPGKPVVRLDRRDDRWVLGLPSGEEHADAIILAVPAGRAASLLAPHDTDAAATLRATEYASVGVVTLAYSDDAVPDDLFGTGLLVPRRTPLPRATAEQVGAARGEAFLVTACTYLWAKWPHLARPGQRLVRASVGSYGDDRFAALDDDRLIARVVTELGTLLDTTGPPLDAVVTRWPDALPQYRVHHLLRVGAVEAALRRLGGIAVAGAAYHGVGIPACIKSGRDAARAVLAELASSGHVAAG